MFKYEHNPHKLTAGFILFCYTMAMKIKLKESNAIRFNLILGVYLLIIWGCLTRAQSTFGISRWEAWQQFLQETRQESLFNFLLLSIFPWALLLMVGGMIWAFIQKLRLNARKPRLVSVSFEEKGAVLEYSLSRPAIFLPYNQTDFTLCARTILSYNKYHQPICHLAYVEMIFASPNGKFSAQHRAGIPIIPKILNEGKKFRSCSVNTKTACPDNPTRQEEKDFISFLQDQMNNYLHYGVMLTVSPQQSTGFLILGATTLIIPLMLIAVLAPIVQNSSLFLSKILCVLWLIMLAISVFCFSKYIGYKRTIRKLERLKQEKK